MLNYLMNFIAALIGGALSLLGSMISANITNKKQSELNEKAAILKQIEQEEYIRKITFIILIDLIEWIRFSVEWLNEVNHHNHVINKLPHSERFQEYISDMSKNLSYEEIHLITKMYGYIENINLCYSFETSHTREKNKYISALSEFACLVIKDEVQNYYRKVDPQLITTEDIMSNLKPEFKKIIRRLDDICGNELNIILS